MNLSTVEHDFFKNKSQIVFHNQKLNCNSNVNLNESNVIHNKINYKELKCSTNFKNINNDSTNLYMSGSEKNYKYAKNLLSNNVYYNNTFNSEKDNALLVDNTDYKQFDKNYFDEINCNKINELKLKNKAIIDSNIYCKNGLNFYEIQSALKSNLTSYNKYSGNYNINDKLEHNILKNCNLINDTTYSDNGLNLDTKKLSSNVFNSLCEDKECNNPGLNNTSYDSYLSINNPEICKKAFNYDSNNFNSSVTNNKLNLKKIIINNKSQNGISNFIYDIKSNYSKLSQDNSIFEINSLNSKSCNTFFSENELSKKCSVNSFNKFASNTFNSCNSNLNIKSNKFSNTNFNYSNALVDDFKKIKIVNSNKSVSKNSNNCLKNKINSINRSKSSMFYNNCINDLLKESNNRISNNFLSNKILIIKAKNSKKTISEVDSSCDDLTNESGKIEFYNNYINKQNICDNKNLYINDNIAVNNLNNKRKLNYCSSSSSYTGSAISNKGNIAISIFSKLKNNYIKKNKIKI